MGAGRRGDHARHLHRPQPRPEAGAQDGGARHHGHARGEEPGRVLPRPVRLPGPGEVPGTQQRGVNVMGNSANLVNIL